VTEECENLKVRHSILSLEDAKVLREPELKCYSDDPACSIPEDPKQFRKLCSLLNLLEDVEEKEEEQEDTKCPGCLEEYRFDLQGRKNPLQLNCGQAHFVCRECLGGNLEDKFEGYQSCKCLICEKECIVKKGSIKTQLMSESKRKELEPMLQRRLELDKLRPIVSKVIKLIRNKVTIPDLYDTIKSDKKLEEFVDSKVQTGKQPDKDWVAKLVPQLRNSCLQNQSPLFKLEVAKVLLARVRGSCAYLCLEHHMKAIVRYGKVKQRFFGGSVVTAGIAAGVGHCVLPDVAAGALVLSRASAVLVSIPLHVLSVATAVGGGVLGFLVELAYNYCYTVDRFERRLRILDSSARWGLCTFFTWFGMGLGAFIGVAGGPFSFISVPVCSVVLGFIFGTVGYIVGYFLGERWTSKKLRLRRMAPLTLAFIRLVGKNPCTITLEDLKGAKGKSLKDTIRKKFYAASREIHPDKAGKESTKKFQELVSQKQIITKWLTGIETGSDKTIYDKNSRSAINALWKELEKKQNLNYDDALAHCRAQEYITCLETSEDTKGDGGYLEHQEGKI